MKSTPFSFNHSSNSRLLKMSAKAVFFLLITTTSLMSSYSSRELPEPAIPGQALDCWAALSEIRSCSNEIAAYFSNGAIDITPPCCEAISQVTHDCWPALLGTLGFGPDQTFVLRGYCDASASFAEGLGPVPSPAGQPLPAEN